MRSPSSCRALYTYMYTNPTIPPAETHKSYNTLMPAVPQLAEDDASVA